MSLKLRAIDQEAFSSKNRKDFKSRNHGMSNKRVFELILASIAVILGTMILVHLRTLEGGLVCLGAGLILLVFSLQTEKYKTIIERSEFLNALFSSVASEGYKFCIIANKKDGRIVYLNQGFQKLFPEAVAFERRSVGKLLLAYKVDKAKAKLINAAVKKAAKKTYAVEFNGSEKSSKMKLYIEPIKRPSGFVLIRGE